MKAFITSLLLFGFALTANAQLSQGELNKLNSQQRQIYLNQQKELNDKLRRAEYDLYKAEDMIKMAMEIKGDNAKFAEATHKIRGMELKEKAERDIREAKEDMQRLDSAAREAIRNNEKNKN